MHNDQRWLAGLLMGISMLVEQIYNQELHDFCNSWLQEIEVIGQITWK